MKPLLLVRELAEDFFSLLFPKICIHCGKSLVFQEDHLCTKCRLDLPRTNYHLDKENPVYQKLVYEPKVKAATAFLHFHQKGLAQSIIHHLKYKDRPELGEWIGRIYGETLQLAGWPIDLIVPVPLHPSKLRKRGFNQSEHIAMGLSAHLGVPIVSEAVIRTVRTASQTRKTKLQRLQNVHAIYSVSTEAKMEGKNILLVDDVLTTGATVGELAATLADAGANALYVAVLAAGK